MILGTILILDTRADNIVTRQQILTANKALTAAIEVENECTVDEECAILPVGSRACGGPSSYVAYSLTSSNQDEIHSLSTLTTSLEKKYNHQNGIMSMCMILPEPTAVCDASHQCVTQSSEDEFF